VLVYLLHVAWLKAPECRTLFEGEVSQLEHLVRALHLRRVVSVSIAWEPPPLN
jgi:hypothetical protein